MNTAIVCDIHGNTPAFTAVLADIEQMGCGTILVLGDIINGIDPQGSLALVRGLGERAVCLRGNAEAYTLTPDLDGLPDRGDADQAHLVALIRWFRAHLSADDLDWLARLPDACFWQGACLVHDSPFDRLEPQGWHAPGLALKYQEWYYHSAGLSQHTPDAVWQRLWAWMEQKQLWGVFCGHTHAPFIRQSGGRWAGNAGGAGFPLDGDPRPSWLLLEGEPGGQDMRLSIRRVAYDVQRVLRLIDERPDYLAWEGEKRREYYRKMLVTGLHWRFHKEQAQLSE
jgi:predicted phosphodiesterase